MCDEPKRDALTGSPCRNCPEGTYHPARETKLLERSQTVLVVKEVPAQVCDLCGDALTTSGTTRRLLEMLSAAEGEGVEMEVRRFAPSPGKPAPA